uniref:(northern house mosquito) hypothetical protein n=1 Tax=Culex pipiens TaxID=7175 RepID=A0A8D8G6L5_CULPI
MFFNRCFLAGKLARYCASTVSHCEVLMPSHLRVFGWSFRWADAREFLLNVAPCFLGLVVDEAEQLPLRIRLFDSRNVVRLFHFLREHSENNFTVILKKFGAASSTTLDVVVTYRLHDEVLTRLRKRMRLLGRAGRLGCVGLLERVGRSGLAGRSGCTGRLGHTGCNHFLAACSSAVEFSGPLKRRLRLKCPRTMVGLDNDFRLQI